MKEQDQEYQKRLKALELGLITVEDFETLTGQDAPAQYKIGNVGEQAVIAQGNGAVAAKGDVYIDSHKVTKPEQARHNYLTKLYRKCNALALLDDQTGGDAIGLNDVYIGLDTKTTKKVIVKKQDHLGNETDEKEERDIPVSANEALERNKRIVFLGDPGSGKSSFVRHLAAHAAGQLLKDEQPAGNLPILIDLRRLAVLLTDLDCSKLNAEETQKALLAPFWQQLENQLEEWDAETFKPSLQKMLTDGNALLIFDGLDEVAQDARETVRNLVVAVRREYPRIIHTVITCRVRSWQSGLLPADYHPFTIAPFDQDKINAFIKNWYNSQVASGRYDRKLADARIRDLQSVATERQLIDLSENPLLLTSMALIHQRNTTLPRQRVLLYKETVNLLLSRWQELNKEEVGALVSAELADILRDELRIRPILEEIAFTLHSRQQTQDDAKLNRGNLLVLLERTDMLGTVALANEFLDYVDQRAGILVGEGGAIGQPAAYDFPHRTFQEYLAGYHIFRPRERTVVGTLQNLAAHGDYWTIPVELGAEEVLFCQTDKVKLLDIAYRCCDPAESEDTIAQRLTLWSAAMAKIIGVEEVEKDGVADGGTAYTGRLRPRLIHILSDHLPVNERAAAGRYLAHLKDPRTHLTDVDQMPFCFVPSGDFWMGDPKEDDFCLHTGLNYPYWMAQFSGH